MSQFSLILCIWLCSTFVCLWGSWTLSNDLNIVYKKNQIWHLCPELTNCWNVSVVMQGSHRKLNINPGQVWLNDSSGLAHSNAAVWSASTPHLHFSTQRKRSVKAHQTYSSPFLFPVSLVRDKERSKLGRNEIFNTNGCQVPDEQMSKWCMLKSVVNIVSFCPSLLKLGPGLWNTTTYVVNPRSSSLRPH